MHYVAARVDPDFPHPAGRVRANVEEEGRALRIGQLMEDQPLPDHMLHVRISDAVPPSAIPDHSSTIVDGAGGVNDG